MRLSPWPRARRWQLSAVRDRASAHSSVVLCVWVSRCARPRAADYYGYAEAEDSHHKRGAGSGCFRVYSE
jgi:hypothetical protein